MEITKNIMMLTTAILILSMLLVPVVSAESVERELPSSVRCGEEFDVNLVIDDIEIGAVMETIPDGCTYVSCSCPEEQVNISGQNLIIPIINTDQFTYTLKACKVGTCSFTGVWENCVDETSGTTEDSQISVIRKRSSDVGDDDSSSTPAGGISTSSDGNVSDSTRVASKDGTAQLIIAEGTVALTKGSNALQDITIETVKSRDLPPVGGDEQYYFTGHSYRCSPAGATFTPAIKLLFTLTEDEWNSNDSREFVVRCFNVSTNSWDDMQTSADASRHTVMSSISHFSIYALFEKTVEKTPDTKFKPEIMKDCDVPAVQATTSATENPDNRATAAATQAVPRNDEKDSTPSFILFAGILVVLAIVGGVIYLLTAKEDNKGRGGQ